MPSTQFSRVSKKLYFNSVSVPLIHILEDTKSTGDRSLYPRSWDFNFLFGQFCFHEFGRNTNKDMFNEIEVKIPALT